MVTIDITPRQAIEQLESDLGLTSNDLAQALSVSQRTLERWRVGEAYPQRDSREKLAELIELDERLQYAFVSAEAVREWMHTEARYLGWATPADMVCLGKAERALATLEVLESGIFI